MPFSRTNSIRLENPGNGPVYLKRRCFICVRSFGGLEIGYSAICHTAKTRKINRDALGYASTACTRNGFSLTADQRSIAVNSRRLIQISRNIHACQCFGVLATGRSLTNCEVRKCLAGVLCRKRLHVQFFCLALIRRHIRFYFQHVYQGEIGQATGGAETIGHRNGKS